MRIASVLHDASPEPDGAPLFPTVALERDGSLYSVAALARAFGPRYAALLGDANFEHAVIALRGETLHELDRRLRAGERPTAARIQPGTFTWLPPCDMERAAFVACEREPPTWSDEQPRAPAHHARAERDGSARALHGPAFHIGSARAFYGHDATVPLLADDALLAVMPALAVVLGDDLFRATADEADRAILGYTLLLRFGEGHAAQLGPVLVTRDEAGPTGGLRAQLRVNGLLERAGEAGASPFSAAESIAWISHHVPLRAGDVIAAAPIETSAAGVCTGAATGGDDTRAPAGNAGGSSLRAPATTRAASNAHIAVPHGTRVDFAIERIGKLSGKPARGPDMRAWRRDAPQRP